MQQPATVNSFFRLLNYVSIVAWTGNVLGVLCCAGARSMTYAEVFCSHMTVS